MWERETHTHALLDHKNQHTQHVELINEINYRFVLRISRDGQIYRMKLYDFKMVSQVTGLGYQDEFTNRKTFTS